MYCTNENCIDRALCKHSEIKDNARFVFNEIMAFEHHCPLFQCKHKYWRNFPSFNKRICDDCRHEEPYFNEQWVGDK